MTKYIINRYPIMATLAYRVAKKLGYSDNFSKSLGVAVATNYAILKNVAYGFYGKKRAKGEKTLDEQVFNSFEALERYETMLFCGCSLIVDRERELVIGLALVRGRQTPFYPEKFEREIWKIKKIRKGAFEYLCKKIDKALEGINVKNIAFAPFAGRGQGYFRFWTQIRDEFRTPEFFRVRV